MMEAAAAGARPTLSRERLEGLLGGGARSAVERLPLLRSALERTGALCTEELRSVVSMPVRLVLADIRSGTAGDVLAMPGGGAFGVLAAPAWRARLVACAGRDAVLAIVELLLGGDGSQPAFVADRPLTTIETSVAGHFFAGVGRALAQAFAGIADTAVTLEGAADKVDADLVSPQQAMVAARFRLDALGRSVEIVLAIPRAALEAMGKALDKPAPKAAAPRPDARWMQSIQTELARASVRLSATLEERMGILGEIVSLQVGQVIPLTATPHTRLQVECNGERLMWCHLGKSNGFYTLRVDAFVDREQEFMDDILAA
jgi:flagellar motor switch protein FliM